MSECRGAAGSGVLPAQPGSTRSAPGVPVSPRVPAVSPRSPLGAVEAPGPRGWAVLVPVLLPDRGGLPCQLRVFVVFIVVTIVVVIGARAVVVGVCERLWCFPPPE